MDHFSLAALVSLACGLTCALIPDPDSTAGKTLRTVASLVLVTSVLSPLAGLASASSRIADSVREMFAEPTVADVSPDLLLSSGVADVSGRISSRIADAFGIPASDLSVSVTFDTSDPASPRISETSVILAPAHRALCERISSFVTSLTEAPCTVTAERSTE